MDLEQEHETRQALERIAGDGSDLTKPLDMDFFVAVPSESVGQQVADVASRLGFTMSVEPDSETQEWTCYCTKTLIPSLSEVVDIERQLDVVAQRFGGHIDGFGTFGNGKS